MPFTRFLSKSDYLSGLVCHRKLWQRLWDRGSGDPPGGISQLNMTMGVRFGELAQRLFPGATLIDVAPGRLEAAVAATETAITSGAQVILEAAFAHEHFRIVADIIERQADSRWHLIEVKSSLSVKDEHIADLAYQRWVMEQSGQRVSHCTVIHANSDGQWPDAESIFARSDVSERVDAAMDDVADNLRPMLTIMDRARPVPSARAHYSKACHECEFKKPICWHDIEDFTIYDVVNASKLPALEAQGILYIDEMPDDFVLGSKDKRHVDLIKARGRAIDWDAIRDCLAHLVYPVYYLDFESIRLSIPLFDGTYPWQQLAFQYSLHIQHEAGGPVEHLEYLHQDDTNPSEALAQHLVDDIGDTGSIVVYHAQMESGVLRDLQRQVPRHADALESMLHRIWDLEILFLKHYRDWRFGSKSSIKVVLPVLIPALSYKDLDVQDGGSASLAWINMRETGDPQKARVIAEQLREYCALDTLAMVKLLDYVVSKCADRY